MDLPLYESKKQVTPYNIAATANNLVPTVLNKDDTVQGACSSSMLVGCVSVEPGCYSYNIAINMRMTKYVRMLAKAPAACSEEGNMQPVHAPMHDQAVDLTIVQMHVNSMWHGARRVSTTEPEPVLEGFVTFILHVSTISSSHVLLVICNPLTASLCAARTACRLLFSGTRTNQSSLPCTHGC